MSKRKLIQELSPNVRVDENLSDGPRRVLAGELHVLAWSPSKSDEGGTCTEVHLEAPIPGTGASVIVRLKSARALDLLVGSLLQQRAHVWGPR